MTRKIGFSKVSWLGVLAGLLGYFFHATMRSGGSAIPLVAFSVLMALLFWLSAVTLEKKSRYDEVFRPMRSDFICNTLGAIGLGAGCVMGLKGGGTAVLVIGLLGLFGALALLTGGVFRMKKSVPSAACYVPAILYYVCKLFYDFRRWMHDPAILDYCFCLFALICFMIATYHAASFSFDHGGRRRLCFRIRKRDATSSNSTWKVCCVATTQAACRAMRPHVRTAGFLQTISVSWRI